MCEKTRTHLVRLYAERIRAITDNAIRFHWTHERIIDSLKHCLWNEAEYQTLPEREKSYLSGYQAAQMERIQKRLVFSYAIVFHGRTVRATIDSDEYKSISAQEICERFWDTGCFVWRDATDKRYDNPRSER